MTETQPAISKPLDLTRGELAFLEDALQRDAEGLLRHPEPGHTVLQTLETPAYRANRALFSKVWDALYT